MDSDDDIYEPNESSHAESKPENNEINMEDAADDVEEGEEEESSSDDDINFITDAKAKPSQPETSSSTSKKPTLEHPKPSATPQPFLKTEASSIEKPSTSTPQPDRPGTDYPARHTSTLDINSNPIHPLTGKPIQSTDFDTDFPTESSKPWRRPGSDITDFFNYGFDEFTWASYCLKQQNMPKEIKEINAQAEQMKAFVEGIPGGGVVAGAVPGMPDEAAMMQMMQGMMQSGMDPAQMDPQQMMQMMMGGGMQGMGAQGGFQPPAGPQGGYAGGGGGYGGGGGGGAFGGRGRGRRGR